MKKALGMVAILYTCFRFKYDVFRKKIIPFEAVNRKNNSTRQYIWWKLDSSRRINGVFTDRLCLPLAKNRTENIALSLHEIEPLTFFNVPLFIFLNEIQGKQNIPRALYGRFDPSVFTFNLETETVSTLIFFQ